MKTKFFIAAMAVIAMVGCNKEVDTKVPSLDGPSAMLKVNLKSAGTVTKAYSAGTAAENAVSSVNFYFYDAAGQPYSVVAGSNSIKWNAKTPGTAENIEAVSDVVLVIKQAETTPPAKVVAVLNDATNYQNLALAELGSKVVNALHTGNTNFVMSNSVYYDENHNAIMVASEITQENIFVDADYDGEAGSVYEGKVDVDPIDIYVERVAAKVSVNFGTDNLVPVKNEAGTQMVDPEGNAVYVDFTGWDVTNATDEAYLVKNLSTSYSWTGWNAASDYRSYWANTTDTPEHKHSFTALESHTAAYDYYFENTHETEKSQLIVAARLVDAAGDNISLAKWYNVLYTVADAKVAVVNTLASKVYVADGETKVSVGVDDVVFYQTAADAADNRYEVLVKAKDGVTYYKADGKTAYTADEIKAVFEAVEPIMMWEEGMTYYFVTINHLAGAPAGIVRNHEYQVNVTGVKGFGTPVYDPDMIITPEYPDPQDALNLAAQINVLSWNVVSQDVELGF